MLEETNNTLQYQSLDDEQLIQDWMLEGAKQQMRVLFGWVHMLADGFRLLRFLHLNANTLMTMEDIAYLLKQPLAAVERNLYAMVDFGLVRWTDVAGLAFFGLTTDLERRQVVRELYEWQNCWRARQARIGQVINGKAENSFQPDVEAQTRNELYQAQG